MNEISRVYIGRYIISTEETPIKTKVYLTKDDGEAMEIDEKKFEKYLKFYFDEKF